ncbi:monocarboxylate transporter 14-like [Tigriopus californicus]|nr:monocarboxylate transporter 14-like [Tigriopus californicus]|eukprot:TCALIF_11071-PA protein Name:"Similar to Slc16a12 Monocarboxylate transporter 12 (Mus musculus)" AED:0.08 eAED:0.08 QI:0/-1/0/1/-1/1/1/0/818
MTEEAEPSSGETDALMSDSAKLRPQIKVPKPRDNHSVSDYESPVVSPTSLGQRVQFADSTKRASQDEQRPYFKEQSMEYPCRPGSISNSPQKLAPPNSPKRNLSQKRNRRRTLSDASYFSAADSPSLSRSSSLSSASYTFVAPDGGWGWVIVMASFLVNMIADGITFSFGVIFVELQSEFQESKALTAGVVSLFHSVPLLSGPIASALTDRYGCRKMTILGSIMATVGFLLSTLVHRLEMLYLTFGLLAGFGLSLCYVSAIVIVAFYFDRKRSLATGISVCGTGVGTFLFAPFSQYLISEFGGWRGATVILAGILLNMTVCGMLFKDLEWTIRARKLRKRNRTKGSQSSMSSQATLPMPSLDELKTLLQHGDVNELFSEQELQQCPRLWSSLIDIPTFINNKEKLPNEVVTALSKNQKAYELIAQNYPEILASGLLNDSDDEDIDVFKGRDRQLSVPSDEPTGAKLKRKVSSLFKKNPNRSILKRPQTYEPAQDLPNESFVITMPNQEAAIHHQRTLNHLRIRRQSLTHRGAMLHINKYRLRASSCPDIYRNSMTSIAQGEEEEAMVVQFAKGLKNFLLECCQWNFFNPQFVVFCLSNFILYAWYDVMYVYLVDYAEQDLGFGSSATFLISIIGIFNTVGELIIGWMGDQPWIGKNLVYAICMIACAFATAVVPFLTQYSFLAIMAGLYGLAISANYSLTSPILVDLVSLEQFSTAYGFLLLIQGLSNLVGPPFAGYLYDVTLNWIWTFGLAGLFIGISGLLLLIIPSLKKYRKIKRKRTLSGQRDPLPSHPHSILESTVTLHPTPVHPVDIINGTQV